MSLVKVLLTHTCNLPGSTGVPGQVVEVEQERAEAWFANGGAKPVADQPADDAEAPDADGTPATPNKPTRKGKAPAKARK